jgi:hypothetical protein
MFIEENLKTSAEKCTWEKTKTTTATLVAKEAGRNVIELNASDGSR